MLNKVNLVRTLMETKLLFILRVDNPWSLLESLIVFLCPRNAQRYPLFL